MSCRRFVITYAVNATPIHDGFWAALKSYRKRTGAHLIVCKGYYKNPTSRFSREDSDGDWWAEETLPHLQETRLKICRNLTLYADVPCQPTDSRPLSGFEVYCGESSGIFPHPRRALTTVPGAGRMPRLLVTTGACTVANYTRSKRGKKAEAHHSIGALVVEIEADGTYHLRHISAERSGAFIDLDTHYHPDRSPTKAAPALGLSLGDIHSGRECEKADAGTKELIELIKPRNVFCHDTLDMHSRSHHEKTLMGAHTKRVKGAHWDDVEAELECASGRIRTIGRWGKFRTWIIRSNHDTHFERWLEECEPKKDVKNAPYYFAVWARMFQYHKKHGCWPMAFELEARRIGVGPRVRFLKLNESKRIKGVEYTFHGHIGPNGSRGTLQGLSKLGTKTTSGHGHGPGILDGADRGGVFGDLDHGYNNLPSGWLVAHVPQYANGKRAVIILVDGRFRAK